MAAQTTRSKKSAAPPTNSFSRWSRRICLVLLVSVSVLSLTIFTAVHWIERQVLTTDNWVAFVSPLPKQPPVYNALGQYIATQLFSKVPVEQEIAEALPPKAAFLADPLADQLKKLTTQLSQKAVASDNFQTIWVAANRAASTRLLEKARGEAPARPTIQNERFHLDLNSVKPVLRERLGSVAPALFSDKSTTSQDVSVDTNLKARQQRVRQFVRGMDFLNAVLPTLIAASLLGALALSRARRHLVMIFSCLVIGLMLLETIAVKALRPEILSQFKNADYRQAVATVYDSLFKSFTHGLNTVLVVSVIVLIICLLSGRAAWARQVQGYLHIEKLRNSGWMKNWRQLRLGLKARKYYVWLGLLGVILVYLAFVATVTWRSALNSLLVWLATVAAVQIVATPPSRSTAKATLSKG